MWLWPLIIPTLLDLNPVFAFSRAPHPSPTPSTVPSESAAPQADSETNSQAQALLKQGEEALDKGRMKVAISRFERLIAGYPAAPGFTQAHRLLGVAYLRAGAPQKAVAPLKYFVEARSRFEDGNRARLLLADAYLNLSQFSESLLTAGEILSNRESLPADLETEAEIRRAQALIGLGRDSRAREAIQESIQAMRGLEAGPKNAELRAKADLILFDLKVRECEKLPVSGPLGEAEVRNQLDRRGICLLESALRFRDVLASNNPDLSRTASSQFKAAWNRYSEACQTPPTPPGGRSALEAKRYQAELRQQLIQDCRSKYSKLLGILNTWKDELPSSARPRLEQAEQLIKTLRDSP